MVVSVSRASELLRAGEVVGIPTDTVYGFAVLAEYSNKVYQLKNRTVDKKLINFIHEYRQIGEVDNMSPTAVEELANKYWPGSTTLIFQQNGELRSYRIPDQKDVEDLLRELDENVLTTSANISGEEPCLSEEEFIERFPDVPVLMNTVGVLSGIPSKIYRIVSKDEIKELR